MTSLAELTAALRKKDDEKSTLMTEIKSYVDLRNERNVVGCLKFCITESFISDMNYDIIVNPESSFVAVGSSDFNNKVTALWYQCFNNI